MSPARCIGVFDSGVGGLSVLRALHAQWPQAPLLYLADSGHAPYGERTPAFVLDRSRRIMVRLREDGAAGMVIACNTATAIAVHTLRQEATRFPDRRRRARPEAGASPRRATAASACWPRPARWRATSGPKLVATLAQRRAGGRTALPRAWRS
jgi:hypothetical protein